jgi:Na+/proline symporter
MGLYAVSGLLIDAILAAAMEALSAVLNSLSSTLVTDCYTRLRLQSTERNRMRLSPLAMGSFGFGSFCAHSGHPSRETRH